MKKSLLEILIDEYGFTKNEAAGLILAGKVYTDNRLLLKSGEKLDPETKIMLKDRPVYVSRGAYKLKKALEFFKPQISSRVILDAGSSTGGFTQVLLEWGASLVYAVDGGENQLSYILRSDKRVRSIEKRLVQNIIPGELDPIPEFFTADLSFTSSVFVVDYIVNKLLIKNGIILIKPQFEYERLKDELGLAEDFDGIVKKDSDRELIISKIDLELSSINVNVIDKIESPIRGTKGNIEYLYYIKSGVNGA